MRALPVGLPLADSTDWLAAGVLAAIALAIAGRLLWLVFSHPDTWRQGALTVLLRAFCATVFGQHVRHTSTIPGHGAALVVANHRSPTDPLIMHAAASFQDGRGLADAAPKKDQPVRRPDPTSRRQRVVEWITAREYVEIGGPIEWICRAAFSIPVDRGGNDMAAVKEALKRLKAGRIIGIFPEGKINVGEGLLEFNPGLAFIAARGGVPVIPAYINDAPGGPAMTTMVQPFLTPTTASVTFGQPLDFTHMRKPTAHQRLEITDQIREAIIAIMPPEKRAATRRRDRLRAEERAAAEAAEIAAKAERYERCEPEPDDDADEQSVGNVRTEPASRSASASANASASADEAAASQSV